MPGLIHDVRYSIRMLVRNPAFSAAAVITLALGIGANTAIFSVVHAVLLRPLPYREASRIVLVWQVEPQLSRAPVTVPDFLEWREQNQAFEIMAAGTQGLGRAALTGTGQPEAVEAAPVSSGMFEILGARTAIGRMMNADEDVPGRDGVAVLSYGLWQRQFGSDPEVIGRIITLDGKTREVIGVMQKDFVFPRIWGMKPDVYIPLALTPEGKMNRSHWLYVLARLKPGAGRDQAETEIKALAARQAKLHPENSDIGARLEPLADNLVGSVRNSLLVLFGVVGFVLLIACANVASLMLARTTERQRELAIRNALGAARTRLVRQLLTDSILLSAVGGAAGVLLAFWAKDLLIGLSPEGYIPRVEEVSISTGVLWFTLAVSVATGLLFGSFPALRLFRSKLNDSLRESGRTQAGGPESSRIRSLLVVAEIMMATVLLIGAGLMIRTVQKLASVDLGFATDRILSMRVEVPPTHYRTWEQVRGFFEAALTQVRTLPGVAAAALTSQLPLGSGPNSTIQVEHRAAGFGEGPLVQPTSVTPDYFATLAIPLLRGRTFAQADTPESSPVVVINEALAKHYWPGESPLGKRLSFGRSSVWLEVVGVVGNSRRRSVSGNPVPEVYFSCLQRPDLNMKLVVRSSVAAAALSDAIRERISAVDKDIPVYGVSRMEDLVSDSTRSTRYMTLLMSIFGMLAVVLAATGIYGLISYAVTRRKYEIGVRMALGAETGDVMRMIFRKAAFLVLTGVVSGFAAAAACTQVLAGMLYGVERTDPGTFAGVALVLVVVATVASCVPARKATRVDPINALRCE